MGDVHPLIITFYRLALSALFLLPLIIKDLKSTITTANKIKTPLFFAGLFLALHFYFWITSLQLTTVGNSIFLESTHPLFAWILSVLILKERVSKSLLPALILGLLGMYLMIYKDLQLANKAILGDFLAVLSAFFVAAYLLIARIQKEKLKILPYLFLVYGSAATISLLFCILYGLDIWALSAENWFWLLLLAVGPNAIGHSVLNWASRLIPVYMVNMALLSESVLATIYAALLLNEIPPLLFYAGAVCIFLAIISVFWTRK